MRPNMCLQCTLWDHRYASAYRGEAELLIVRPTMKIQPRATINV